MIEPVQKGAPFSARHQNRLIDAVNECTNNAKPPQSYARLVLFTLTSPVVMPDLAGAGVPNDREPTPYATARRAWCAKQSEGDAYPSYGDDASSATETIYFPTSYRNGDGYAIGPPSAGVGMSVWCVWNAQSGRWEAIVDAMGPKFYNAASTAAPPFALMAVIGIQTLDSGEVVPMVDKPSTTFYRQYLVNGAAEVASETVGIYQDTEMVRVAYDSGTPAVGEGWGPKAAQWTATKNYPATCLVAGIYDSDAKIMLARVCTIDRIIGELAEALAPGGTATVHVCGGTGGSETVIASLTVTARDWLMKSGATAIASGKKVIVEWINGIAYITEAECP